MPRDPKTPLSLNERLHQAATTGDLTELNAVVALGVNLNYVNNANGVSPLIRAIRHQQMDFAKRLLALGASPTRQDIGPVYDQAMHVAARKGCSELILALLAAGAAVDELNRHSNTPLHEACAAGQAATVLLLIQRGADVHARDELTKQPLHHALAKGHLGVVQLLMNQGADPHHNRLGESPMDWARRKNRPELVAAMERFALRQVLNDTFEDLPEPVVSPVRPRL